MNKLLRRQLGINRARRILKIWRATWNEWHDEYLADGGRCEQLLRKTRTPFSRNARKRYGITIQEHRAPLVSDYLGSESDPSI